MKTNRKMSTEILSFDSALLSPLDQSFFNEDCLQQQHCSEITDEWLQQLDVVRPFYDGFELGPDDEPEFALEVMTRGLDTQYQSKSNDIIEYLESTAFLSPQSIEPSSPSHYAEQEAGLDSEAAISLLEEMLVANSDCDSTSEQFYDELTIPVASEESDSSATRDSSIVVPQARPKRQVKRKAQEEETITKPKPKTKRGRSNETQRERKRKQNKCAANRYRQKKRAEMDGMEKQYLDCEDVNAQLKAQLQKLQMEFKVVYPLAKAAFASDPNRSLLLQMLDIRVLNGELLE